MLGQQRDVFELWPVETEGWINLFILTYLISKADTGAVVLFANVICDLGVIWFDERHLVNILFFCLYILP